MNFFIHFINRHGLWNFVSTFTLLAIILSEGVALLLSDYLTGSFFDKNILIAGLIIPSIVAFILSLLSGSMLSHSRQEHQKSLAHLDSEENQKKRFLQYLNIVDVMIVALDTEGKITLANQKTSDFMGLKDAQELLGKDWFSFYIPDDIYPQVHAAFLDIIQGNLAPYQRYENEIKLKDGSTRLIVWNNEYIYDNQNQIIGVLSSGKDITEERKAQLKLEEQSYLLRTVIDQIPDPLVLKDKKGKFLLANQACAELYNTTVDDIIGKDDGDYIPDQKIADSFRQNVLSIMKNGKTEIVYEDSIDVRTGKLRHYRSIKKPFKNADNESQVLILANDITTLKEQAEALEEEKNRFALAIEGSQDGIWDWNLKTNEVFYSPRYLQMLGYTPAEIEPNLFFWKNHLHPEDIQQALEDVNKHLSGKSQVYENKHRLKTKQGEWKWILARGKAHFSADGKPQRFVGFQTDISQQVKHQERPCKLDCVNAHQLKSIKKDKNDEQLRSKSTSVNCKRIG